MTRFLPDCRRRRKENQSPQKGRHEANELATLQVVLRPEQEERETLMNTQQPEERLGPEQWLRQDRVYDVGLMTSGLVHELNNIFTGISLAVGRLGEQHGHATNLAAIEVITAYSQRGSHLVGQLLKYLRGGQGVAVWFQPGPPLAEVLHLMEATFPRNLQIQTALPPSSLFINGDPVQFQQVVMNLMLNGRDALPTGGVLKVSLAEERWAADQLARQPGAKAGWYVVLRVADTGGGNSGGGEEPPVRAVFHDQGRRERHRPWADDGPGNCESVWRIY